MIHVDVLASSDPLALGLYEFEYNYLYIGRSKKNDLIFLDKEIPAMFLKLFIYSDGKNEQLVVKNNKNDPFYFINGKKVSGSIKLKNEDVVSFASIKFQIKNFKKNEVDVDLSSAYEEFEKNANDLRPALDFIEEVIIDFEKMDLNV